MNKTLTLNCVLKQDKVNIKEQIWLVLKLSIPAILAQLTSIAMQYIDTAMVGTMGAAPMAAIGLMSTSTWLIGGMCIGLSSGFSVQAAQLFGGDRDKEARNVFRQGIIVLMMCGIIISLISISLSYNLPIWLGGDKSIIEDARTYFFIYSCSIPFDVMRCYFNGMMQSSGDMKTPSILSALVCVFDVILNMLLIFPTRQISLGSFSFIMPGFGLKVAGAALGTALSQVLIALLSMYFVCVKSKKLSFALKGEWKIRKNVLKNAFTIAIPMTFDHIFMCSAYLVSTILVAPLGNVAVAANSIAITAESICYMPGYGIGTAASVIIGQTIGADRKDLTKKFSRMSVIIGVLFMSAMAVVMYFIAPDVFNIMTSDSDVASLSASVLRIELFAEPFYAMAICCNGAFRGAGDTLIPGIINLFSMWGVRILLAFFIVPVYGLYGYWIAMTVELIVRGIVFLSRMLSDKWMNKKYT